MTEDSDDKLPISTEQQPPIPPSNQPTAVRRRIEARYESYEGPLPKPSDLQGYENIIPGAADRILRMAENQAEHRQFLEKTVVRGDSRRAFCGLWVGGFIAFSVLAGAVFLISTGHDIAGAVVGGLDIVSLAAVFVYGTVSRRTERTQKAELMKRPHMPPDDTQHT